MSRDGTEVYRMGSSCPFTSGTLAGVCLAVFVAFYNHDSRFDFRLEMFDMSLEGEFTV